MSQNMSVEILTDKRYLVGSWRWLVELERLELSTF